MHTWKLLFSGPSGNLRVSSPIWASEASLARTRERAAKRSGEAHFAYPNRRACWQAILQANHCKEFRISKLAQCPIAQATSIEMAYA